MLFAARVFFGILVVPIALLGILGSYVSIEQAWRRTNWIAVDARIVSNAPGCIVTFLPKGSVVYQDGPIVSCTDAIGTIKLPEGAQRPRIKKGSIGRLEYTIGGRVFAKEGWIDGLVVNAVAGESIRLLRDPVDPSRLEYGGKFNGLLSGFAIIAACLGIFALYVYFLWLSPGGQRHAQPVAVSSYREQAQRTPRAGFGQRR